MLLQAYYNLPSYQRQLLMRTSNLAKQVGEIVDGRGFADALPAATLRRLYHDWKPNPLSRSETLVSIPDTAFLKDVGRNHGT